MAKIQGPNGQEIEGEFVHFNSVIEEWNEYRVGDYTLKMKVVVSDIFKVKDAKDALGNPVFILTSNNVVTVRKA